MKSLYDERSPVRAAIGFTLLELMVMISIIVVLSALVLGAVTRAKMSAQRIVCMNNLKQWSSAAHLYAQENDDLLPLESAVDGINSWEVSGSETNLDVWYNALAETMLIVPMTRYAQTPSSQQGFYKDGRLFHCPRARFAPVSATYPNFSLAMNSKLMGDFETSPTAATADLGTRRLSEVRAPDRTALFLDGGVPGEERLCPYQAPYTGQPKAFANQFPGRHNQGGNIAFVDGHVRTLQGKLVVEMDPASVFRGNAIFPPGEVVWRHDPRLVP